MSVRFQAASSYFSQGSELLYRHHEHIDRTIYPHIHDYFELTFIQSGSMIMDVNEQQYTIPEGCFILLRPNDVHSKKDADYDSCRHVNIAFLPRVFDDVFTYLGRPELKSVFLSPASLAPLRISASDKLVLQYEINRLSMIPLSDTKTVSYMLRTFIFKVLSVYFFEPYFDSLFREAPTPHWLVNYIRQLSQPEILRLGTDYLYSSVPLSQSHICRTFTKHMRMNPTDYINEQRLTYAANLLQISDISIVDISDEVGFSSLSHFYHLFKKKYHMPPKKFRLNNSL